MTHLTQLILDMMVKSEHLSEEDAYEMSSELQQSPNCTSNGLPKKKC